MNGASQLAIMKHTGHRSLTTVRKYIRDGSLFRDNAAGTVKEERVESGSEFIAVRKNLSTTGIEQDDRTSMQSAVVLRIYCKGD